MNEKQKKGIIGKKTRKSLSNTPSNSTYYIVSKLSRYLCISNKKGLIWLQLINDHFSFLRDSWYKSAESFFTKVAQLTKLTILLYSKKLDLETKLLYINQKWQKTYS